MRLLTPLVVLAVALLGASGALAQSYPSKSVRIIVPFSAGGAPDVIGRVLAQALTEQTGQSFVVENRPGASGLIGSEAVAKSPADGYTLMVGSQTTLAVAPALYRKFTVDAAKDFAGISMIGISPLVAIVNPASPIKSIADLIAFAKSKSEPLMFGSGGVGTTPHMAGELFGFTAGIKMSHVAYRGEAPGVNDVLGQQIPFMFSNASVVLGNVKAGTLRGLAVTTAKRMSFAPEIPTIAETLPDFEAATWFALVAPAGTPRDIVQKLSAEIQRLAALPDTQARFADLGMTSEGSTPEALDAVIKSEIVKWAKVIKDADIKPAD
mgnify:CR=1 FL=1